MRSPSGSDTPRQRDVQHEVAARQRHAGQDVAVTPFIGRQSGLVDRVRHRAVAQAAQTGAASTVAARTGDLDTGSVERMQQRRGRVNGDGGAQRQDGDGIHRIIHGAIVASMKQLTDCEYADAQTRALQSTSL